MSGTSSPAERPSPPQPFTHQDLLHMNTPADSVERGRGSNKTGRNANHAKRSCASCRRRKIRCDEATPECGSCRSRGESCDWSAEPDKRRTRTRTAYFEQTIALLTNQIGALKSRIERFKLRAASDDRTYTPSPPPTAVSTASLGNGSSAHLPALVEGERDPPGRHSLGPDATGAWLHHASTLSVSSASSFDVTSTTSASQPISPRPTRPRLPFLAVTAPSMPIRQRPVSHSRARSDSILQHGSRQRSPAPWKRANRSSSGPRSLVPDGGRQLLEIPVSQDLAFRSTTPEYYAFEFPSPGLGDDHDVGNEQEHDDDPFIVTSLGIPGKRLVTLKGEEGMAVTGNSPLALFSSPVASSNPPVSPSSSSPPTSSFLNMPFHLLSMTPIFSPTRNPSTVSTSPTRTYYEHDLLCNCDWDRHLPSDIRQHLTREDHDYALSQYFAHLTPWHFRVVPALFRRDMRIALSTPRGAPHVTKTPHYSAGLHCAMLAEAGSLAPDGCILKQSSARDTLARTARNLIDDDCLKSVGTLASVIGLAVLAQYHLSIPGRAKFAFSLNGMAVRIARSTGLNFDTTAFVEEEERVDNQWCYLTLFVQDVDMSLHVGQEVTMPVPRFGFAPAPQYISNDAPLVGEVFAQTCALMVKAAQAVTVGCSVDKVTALDTNLRSWREHLPDRLTRVQATQQGAPAHLLMLHITFHWIQIVAHRQFYAPSRYREESRRTVDSACADILDLIKHFHRLHALSRAPPSLVQIAAVGGAAALMQAEVAAVSSAVGNTCIDRAKLFVEALRLMSAVSPSADVYASALEGKIQTLLQIHWMSGDYVHSRGLAGYEHPIDFTALLSQTQQPLNLAMAVQSLDSAPGRLGEHVSHPATDPNNLGSSGGRHSGSGALWDASMESDRHATSAVDAGGCHDPQMFSQALRGDLQWPQQTS